MVPRQPQGQTQIRHVLFLGLYALCWYEGFRVFMLDYGECCKYPDVRAQLAAPSITHLIH